ncbi:MAG: hypothetical protein JXR97_05630, partial [Planctomycetes bacterium]|nr:hypothetical protein [Planctomycetota bacterium]
GKRRKKHLKHGKEDSNKITAIVGLFVLIIAAIGIIWVIAQGQNQNQLPPQRVQPPAALAEQLRKQPPPAPKATPQKPKTAPAQTPAPTKQPAPNTDAANPAPTTAPEPVAEPVVAPEPEPEKKTQPGTDLGDPNDAPPKRLPFGMTLEDIMGGDETPAAGEKKEDATEDKKE